MPASQRRAIIHIGTGKTGSTTIQNLLAANRAALPAHGFAYPESPGARNHLKLAVFATDARRAAKMLRSTGEAASADFVQHRLAEQLGAELAALPAGVHTVIFSSEHLSNQVASAEDARRLRALLDPWFGEYRILLYLRRQDEYAVSLYSTLLRAGRTEADVLAPLGGAEPGARLDWAALLDRWGEAFGRNALLPRVFAPDAFAGGDLLADFAAACGLPALPVPEAAAVLNPSLAPPAQEFLRRLNLAARAAGGGAAAAAAGLDEEDPQESDDEAVAADGADRDAEDAAGKAPIFIRQLLNGRFAGPGRRPSRAEAEAFVAQFAAGNERVRAEFFSARTSLFSTDFSRYPVRADAVPGGDDVLEVALAVVLAQTAETNAHLTDAAFRRGRDRLAAGAAEEARRLFRRALAKAPTHLGALRGLAELATDAAARDEALGRVARALAQEPERRELIALRQRLRRQGDEPPPGRADGEGGPAPASGPAAVGAADGGPDPARPTLSPAERAERRARREERLRRRAEMGQPAEGTPPP